MIHRPEPSMTYMGGEDWKWKDGRWEKFSTLWPVELAKPTFIWHSCLIELHWHLGGDKCLFFWRHPCLVISVSLCWNAMMDFQRILTFFTWEENNKPDIQSSLIGYYRDRQHLCLRQMRCYCPSSLIFLIWNFFFQHQLASEFEITFSFCAFGGFGFLLLVWFFGLWKRTCPFLAFLLLSPLASLCQS